MPSKRKKNKRRMRRVQAQRRALEEQYGSSGKGTPGVCAVSSPVQEPLPKAPRCPIAAQIKPPVAENTPVPAEIPPPELVDLKVPISNALEKDTEKTSEDLIQTRVELPAPEPARIEDENVIVPVTEDPAHVEDPVFIPAQSEIQNEDLIPTVTESSCDVLLQTFAEEPVEISVSQLHVEAVAERLLDPVVPEELVMSECVPVSVTLRQTLMDPIPEPAEVDGPIVEVLDEPAVKSEAVAEPVEDHTITDVLKVVQAESKADTVPAEAPVATEAPVEPNFEKLPAPLDLSPALVELTSDPVTEDFVVKKSTMTVESSITEETLPETIRDAPEVLSETLGEALLSSEPILVGKEILQVPEEFMAHVETEPIKDSTVGVALAPDAINGCLGTNKVAIEG